MTDRRRKLRRVLEPTGLVPLTNSASTCMPIEWLDISRTRLDDVQMERHLRSHDLSCLPGRFFFWSRDPAVHATQMIRFALARPARMFERGLGILARAFERPPSPEAA